MLNANKSNREIGKWGPVLLLPPGPHQHTNVNVKQIQSDASVSDGLSVCHLQTRLMNEGRAAMVTRSGVPSGGVVVWRSCGLKGQPVTARPEPPDVLLESGDIE